MENQEKAFQHQDDDYDHHNQKKKKKKKKNKEEEEENKHQSWKTKENLEEKSIRHWS
ncbi:MAG: hypothetical protein Q8P67_03315 [archaeon]|nr:hypothetical protein [archaeon]